MMPNSSSTHPACPRTSVSLSGSSRVPYLLVLWEGTVPSPLYPQGPAQVPPSAVSMTERKHDQRHLNLLFCFVLIVLPHSRKKRLILFIRSQMVKYWTHHHSLTTRGTLRELVSQGLAVLFRAQRGRWRGLEPCVREVLQSRCAQ